MKRLFAILLVFFLLAVGASAQRKQERGYNAYLWGATGNGTTDDRGEIASVDAWAAAESLVLYFPPNTYRIGSNITIASDCEFETGAALSIDAGVTVTFSGSIRAPQERIFTGSGSVSLTSQAIVHAAWWGGGDFVGFSTVGPDRRVDILDASNPQLRLTQSDGVDYCDFQVDGNGDITVTPSGGDMSLACTLAFAAGTSVNEFSTDGTLAGDSDDAVPTEKAVKTYVDAAVAGISADKITEGDTEVETVDAGDGYIVFTEDGSEVGRWTGATLVAGTGANTLTLDPSSGPAWGGTGRPTRYIEIKPSDLVPEDTSPGSGTQTTAYDETNYETYTRFQSSASNQTLNVMVKFLIPADFSAWAASNAITVRVRTNDITNATMVIYMYQNDNTVDSGVNGASVLPTGNDTWEAKNDQPAGSYTAGQYGKIRLALQGDTDDQCDVGVIRLDYLAAY